MNLKLGVIADDFTGATDIASFMAQAGWQVIQLNGRDDDVRLPDDTDAVVISLKTRSCPAGQAVAESLEALAWLDAHQCPRVYFKYCSTFDSTAKGNIGPVTDALLQATGRSMAVLCPALPVNHRQVIDGNLLVNGVALNESGMQHHPLTPMTDAYLPRVMDAQSEGKTGLIPLATLRQGGQAVAQRLDQLRRQGLRYAVADIEHDSDLALLAAALPAEILLTGGSGLGGAIALAQGAARRVRTERLPSATGRAVILSGSCSAMTNRQVARYQQVGLSQSTPTDNPTTTAAWCRPIEAARCLTEAHSYAAELVEWVISQPAGPAPLLYATQSAQAVGAIQARHGAAVIGQAIEQLFADIACQLQNLGSTNLLSPAVKPLAWWPSNLASRASRSVRLSPRAFLG